MTDRIITTLRAIALQWHRSLQFSAPIQMFHDGR